MLSPSKNNAHPQDPDVRPQSEACIDTGLACFVMLASFLEKPVDPHHLVHQYSPDGQHLSETALLRAARDLKFKAKGVTSSPDRLDKLPLPAIAVDREGQYFILAKIEPPEKGGRVLVHNVSLSF